MSSSQFQATYGKPLLAARDSKCSAKDAEGGALAMEALHKQVGTPFIKKLDNFINLHNFFLHPLSSTGYALPPAPN